jgi:hypothetical protein
LPDEQYFLFENSLGGLDTVRCTGEIKHTPEFTRETALMGDTERTFFAEKKDLKTQTTDWLTLYETEWMIDFFMSKKVYLYSENKIRAIIIDEITAEKSSKENLRSFELTYHPDQSSNYINILQNLTKYVFARYTNPVCQQITEVITYLTAVWRTPVCQQIEDVTNYISATYVSPVCQIIDDSISYTSAEWISPICQLELDFDNIILAITLEKYSLLPNRIRILWEFSEDVGHFETIIQLRSTVVLKIGNIESINTIGIEFTAAGTLGYETQLVANISSFVPGQTTLKRIEPDNIQEITIDVRIILD